MIELKKVYISQGDIEVLKDVLSILSDYEVGSDDYENRQIVLSYKRIIKDFTKKESL